MSVSACKKKNILPKLGKQKALSTNPNFPEPPFDFCNDGQPVGGGPTYSFVVNSGMATTVISTNISAVSFRSTIENAAPNSIIFLTSNVVIDLTGIGNNTITVPSNVTIASDRGVSGSTGAMITTTQTYGGAASFKVGNNVRFTGLRIIGGESGVGTVGDLKERIGILAAGNDGLEVDNCVLAAWPGSAVHIGLVTSSTTASNNNNRIHHNYIYNNRQAGLGYGVCVDNGFATIYKNVFEGNRHDIANSGYRNTNNTGYEAYCNTVKIGGTSHNFDAHGSNGDALANASTFFYIHHNLFMDRGQNRTSSGNAMNIKFRGRPDNQCRIEHNIFYHPSAQTALDQHSNHGGYGNFMHFNNVYNYGSSGNYIGYYVKENWLNPNKSNFMIVNSTDALMSTIGTATIPDYTFGDANGDGKTDIYKIENGVLYTIPYKIQNGLTQTWTALNTTGYNMSQLVFGQFTSDSKTDMLCYESGKYRISVSCTGAWQDFFTTGYGISAMRFGDITGDGIEDFFTTNGSYWIVRNNASWSNGWTNWTNSGVTYPGLKLGWFGGNSSIIDVFHGDGTTWKTSYEGNTNWVTLATTGYTTSQVAIYDFNSDGVSDVINSSGYGQVSQSGTGSWWNCTTNNFPISSFQYIDY